jgi:hypothetical protein
LQKPRTPAVRDPEGRRKAAFVVEPLIDSLALRQTEPKSER